MEKLFDHAQQLGAHGAELAALRREFERSRDESSNRHKEVISKLEELSEASQRRHEAVESLRALVLQCPNHSVDVPVARVKKREDSGEIKAARRSALKAIAAFFAAAATAIGGWWASHSSGK